jgi:hypothetical protein
MLCQSAVQFLPRLGLPERRPGLDLHQHRERWLLGALGLPPLPLAQLRPLGPLLAL